MDRRVWTAVLICFLFSNAAVGCGSGSARNSDPASVTDQIPSDADIINEIRSEAHTAADQNQDLLELKHWKYGVGQEGIQPDEGAIVSYQLVTQEDMNQIIKCLVDGGYLSDQPDDEHTFRSALKDFQHDKGLPANGELDSATLEALLSSDL